MGASNRQMKPNPPPIGRFHFTVHPLYCIFGGFSDPASPKIYDKFYSERGKTSEWTEQMSKISKTFGTVLINMDLGDWGKSFSKRQRFWLGLPKASEMVPEWKDLFDLEASENFIASIRSQNLKKITQLSTKVGKTFTQCYQKHNISVWTRYHWPSTQTIKVLDPIDEEEVNYDQFMHRLSSSLQNIAIHFDQQKYNEPWKAFDIFSKRFRGLRSVCSKCHVTEWTKNSTTVKDFFVGDDIIVALQEIKKTFASGTPNTKLFQKKMEYVSKRSCKMCHLVYQPPAILQRAWSSTP